MKKVKKLFFLLLILISAALIGWGLLLISYSLPINTITNNVYYGTETLMTEGAEFEYATGYKSAILDNETEAIMLSETVFPTDNVIRDSLYVPKYIYVGRSSQVESLISYLHNVEGVDRAVSNYARYWHGYLVFLKVLFSFFNYADLRIMNLGMQIVLLVFILYGFDKAGLTKYALPYTFTMIIWNLTSTGMCMQYYACFYVTAIAVLILLYKQKWLEKNAFRYKVFFMIIGICTSYFDYLTYPIATLGLPLVIWIIMTNINGRKIRELIGNSICWVVGYIGMWAEKWILATIVLGDDVIQNAVNTIISRTSSNTETESVSRIGTVFYLIRCSLVKIPYIIMGGVLFIFITWYFIKKKKEMHTSFFSVSWIQNIIPFIIVSLYPMIWFFLAANHSYIHPRLVYRALGVSVFAFFAGYIYVNECDVGRKQKLLDDDKKAG